ncbi:unnamed protein product [Parnassius mnemosyne]|uniref:Pacifastin domain-containing protein n=1 Tax=Parnassius mnemosyne TaxID=213953 RepID=A0AAV1L969_9NEOP
MSMYNVSNHCLKMSKGRSPCKKTDRVEETLSNRCIRCSCVKNKTQCRYLYGCVMPKRHKQHAGSKIGLSFNTKKDMCVPHSKYTLDCNTCYCEPDGGLRCTLKTCLNYQQAAHLQEQSKYLEKHGL